MLRNHPILTEVIIAVGAFLLLVPFLGGVHLFDWDEINFAESAREMIMTGDYLTVQVDFKPFWEKPPLFIWMQVLSMKAFGINEFAARFPNVICGMITLVVIFRAGRRIYDTEFAWLWVLAYIGSFLPFLYFKSGLMDPWFNLFIFAALLNYIMCLETAPGRKRWRHLLLAAILLGLANLTKGPVSILLFTLTAVSYWALNRFRMKLDFVEITIFVLLLITVGGMWFIIQALNGNFEIIADFIEYQIRLLSTKDAGHGGFPMFHVVVLLFGVFPASIFALKGFRRSYYDANHQKRFKLWMILLFFVVLIVFSLVKTKIVHYSSLCHLPLTFLGAYVIYKIIHDRIKKTRWLNALYAVLGLLIGLSAVLLPFLAGRIDWVIKVFGITDPYDQASLRTDVHWSGLESLIGLLLICGIVLSLMLMKKRRKLAYVLMFLTITLFLNGVLFFTVKKIEVYTQNAVIEFCKGKEGQDCYIMPCRMKSYAHLFYFNKPIPSHPNNSDQDWLFRGPVDKPAYMIIRSQFVKEYQGHYPELELMYEKNGFAFCRRNPPATKDMMND